MLLQVTRCTLWVFILQMTSKISLGIKEVSTNSTEIRRENFKECRQR